MSVLAVIGPTALYLLFSWLLSVIVAQDLSDRKGYGEKPGLATGLLLSAAGAIAWLFVPPKRGSIWSRNVHVFDLLTAVAAVVWIGSLLMPWYEGGGNFFDKLIFYDLLVPIGAAIAYGQLHLRAGAHTTAKTPNIVIGGAALGLLVTILALVTPPDSVEWAAYLSLVAGLVATGGAVGASMVDRAEVGAGEATLAEARRVGAAS